MYSPYSLTEVPCSGPGSHCGLIDILGQVLPKEAAAILVYWVVNNGSRKDLLVGTSPLLDSVAGGGSEDFIPRQEGPEFIDRFLNPCI